MTWRTISAGFKPGERRSARAKQDLVRAYQTLFGTESEAAEVVLADLANFCGFASVPPVDATAETLRFELGLRTVYARIHEFLSLPRDRLIALEAAAKAESFADQEEGIL
jgi:hypothetical protein